MKVCEYKQEMPEICGKPAVAAVKVSALKANQADIYFGDLGAIVADCYLPVCEEHLQFFPDHEGFHLTTA